MDTLLARLREFGVTHYRFGDFEMVLGPIVQSPEPKKELTPEEKQRAYEEVLFYSAGGVKWPTSYQ